MLTLSLVQWERKRLLIPGQIPSGVPCHDESEKRQATDCDSVVFHWKWKDGKQLNTSEDMVLLTKPLLAAHD